LKELRSVKDQIKEDTMRRIDSMGITAPSAWRDEIYKNEIVKLDIKEQLRRRQGINCHNSSRA